MTTRGIFTKYCSVVLTIMFLVTSGCKKETSEPTIDELKNISTPPIPTYPQKNDTGVPVSILFKWDASTWSDGNNHGNFSYNIRYGKSNPPEIIDSLSEDITEYSISGLELNKKYYWKVIAKYHKTVFKECEVFSFTTETGLFPAVPVLVVPLNAITNSTIKPRLTWKTSRDPEGKTVTYAVFLEKNTNPQTKILESQTDTSIQVPSYLEGESQYFWKVVAKDADGNETSSEIRSFTTADKVWITDAIFRAYLKAKFPNAFEGDTLHYKHADVISFNGRIDVSGKNISSLKGIEYFIALTELSCNYNNLISLDLSKNVALKSLLIDYNKLTSLDISNNILLETFKCMGNKITALDISKNSNLTYLNCQDNKLTAFNVIKNNSLAYLYCSNCSLTSLDISNNTALTVLICGSNQLSSLNISNNLKLTTFYCEFNKLTSIDISKNEKLKGFQCAGNLLTSLDLSKNLDLSYLNCQGNMLSLLDVGNNTKLDEIICCNNLLTSLDLSKNPLINRLFCYANNLTNLDLSSQTSWVNLLKIEAGIGVAYNSNPLTLIKVNDAVKDHEQFKNSKANLPTMTIEVYSSGIKTCSSYDPNANGGSGLCVIR